MMNRVLKCGFNIYTYYYIALCTIYSCKIERKMGIENRAEVPVGWNVFP